MGGTWGGNWRNFVDRPHFEYTGGLTVRQLQQGITLPQNQRMPWETTKETELHNKEEVQKLRFHNLSEVPEWARPTIQKLIRKNALQGTANKLDLSMDMLRIFVIHDRLGMY